MTDFFQKLPVFAFAGSDSEPVAPEPWNEHRHSTGYTRHYPPEWMREYGSRFERAEDLEHYVRTEFTARGGLFWDLEHSHLQTATIGIVWSNARHVVKGAEKAGTMELLPDPMTEPKTWAEARQRDYLTGVYGGDWPRWQMTLSGVWAWRYDDRQFFGLVDHELCHAGIARDEFGAPRFNSRTEEPLWKLRPHDVETFVGTAERWGAHAAGAAELVAASLREPRFDFVPGKNFTPAACAACQRK